MTTADMKRCQSFRLGIFLVLTATFLFATGSALIAVIIPVVGTSNVSASRYAAQGLVAIPFFLKKTEDITNSQRKELIFVILSGVCSSFSSLFAYMSLNYIPIMDATVLYNLQPLIVLLISTIWLKEKAGYLDVIIFVVVLLGVINVCQPEFIFGARKYTENSWLGYVTALCNCIPAGIGTCLIRRVKAFNTATILVIQSIVVIPICFIWAAVFGGAGDLTNLEGWLCFLSGVGLSALARALITVSLKYEESYIVALILTTEILFSMVYQMVLFQVFPNWIGVFGALAVMSGIILITLKSKILSFVQKLRKNKDDEKIGLLHEN